MKKTKRLLSIATALAVALSPATAAAAPRLDAQLDAHEVEVGQPAHLEVTVSGAASTAPALPRVPGLSVQPLGSASQITVVNGALDQQTTFHYQVVAERAGTFTIAPITAGGARAAPVQLSARPARPGSRASTSPRRGTSRARSSRAEEPPGRRAFLSVDVEDTDLVVGESTPIVVRAYVEAGTRGTVTGAPELSSDAFAIHDLVEDARSGQTEVRGTPYATLTWRGTLTALLPGDHDVSASVPATLEWRELVEREVQDPFAGHRSLLDRFFGGARGGSIFDDPFFSSAPFGGGSLLGTSWGPPQRASVTLEDELGTLLVREPPVSGRPADYDGAVGRFELSAEATPTSVRAGEPVTLRVRVRGEGSFDRVHHALVPEDTAGLRVYPVTESMHPADGRAGEKVFEQSLVPTRPGSLTLPAMALSYYDPSAGEYVTARTEPIVLDVAPSADGEAVAADLEDAVGPRGHGLAPNALTPGAAVRSLSPMPAGPWPWLAVALVMGLAVSGALVLRRRDPAKGAGRRTRRAARRALRAARRAMREAASRGDAAGFFAAARLAAQWRLGALWALAPEAVTLAEADARGARVPDDLRLALERADALAFAGEDLAHEDLERWRRRIERALDEEMEG